MISDQASEMNGEMTLETDKLKQRYITLQNKVVALKKEFDVFIGMQAKVQIDNFCAK